MKSAIKEQIKVPAHVDRLSDLRDFVTRVGKKNGYSERIINAFKLSIDEAATNIIKHAYRDWDGDIIIRALVKKNSLTFILIDKGKYFDPRQVKDPDLKKYVDIGKKGGLGIFMMRRLLDRIDYRKTENGNELWLTKNRDESKRRKISVASIPLGLKARYWLISMAVFSFILILVYMFFFLKQDNIVLNRYIENGGKACSVLASDLSKNLSDSEDIDEEVIDELVNAGSQDILVLNKAHTSVNTLLKSEYSDILLNAIIVDNIQNILAIAEEDSFYNVLESFHIPEDHKRKRDNVYQYHMQNGNEIVDIEWPILDDENRKLCTVHLFIDYESIKKDISDTRANFFNLGLLVWIIGSAGLFLLIYLVMNPFRRLQEWVKELGQPGVADELDIDTSTEVGEIAKAFSDITMKLRNSQVNLAEQERLQKEMQVAQEIQRTLLPSHFPELEGYDLSSFYEAAKEVGGDYYDFVEVDKDTLGIVVADVSGKGVPGSLVMTMIRTALRTEARGVKDAAEVLTRVNDFVVNDMKKGMFVTLFYVIVDSKRRRINFASAGHNPMILYRTSVNKTYYLNPRGFPIGISLPDKDLFKKSLQSDSIALAEDDILLVYTDGVTEAMNSKRELFGEERFLGVIRDFGKLKAEDFVENLKKEIISFTEGSAQNDDITLVAIKEETSAEKLELKRAKHAFSLMQQGQNVKEACKNAGISTYSYYNKYKSHFEKQGVDKFVIESSTDDLEVRHLSIEEKTKIYDVIKRFPEYGAKRISEELNTEHYNFTKISHSRVYDELVQSRLNTKKLRETFIIRGAKKKRMKPPGTPMLTIDGQIIVDRPKVLKETEPDVTESTDEMNKVSEEKEITAGKTKEKLQPPETAEEPPPEETKAETEIVDTSTSEPDVPTIEPEKDEDIIDVGEIFKSPGSVSESEPESLEFGDELDIDTFADFNLQAEFESIQDAEDAIKEIETESKQVDDQVEIDQPETEAVEEPEVQEEEEVLPEFEKEEPPEIETAEEPVVEKEELPELETDEGPEEEKEDLPELEITEELNLVQEEPPDLAITEELDLVQEELAGPEKTEDLTDEKKSDEIRQEGVFEPAEKEEEHLAAPEINELEDEIMSEFQDSEPDQNEEIEKQNETIEIPRNLNDSDQELLQQDGAPETETPEVQEAEIMLPVESTDTETAEPEPDEETVDELLNSTDFEFIGADESVSVSDDAEPAVNTDIPVLSDQNLDIDQIFYDFEVGKNIEINPEEDQGDHVLDDLGLTDEKTRSQKIEQEEIDLADIMNSDEDIISIPSDDDHIEFDDKDVEDIEIISESDRFENEIKITEPFEEFLGLEEHEKEIPLKGPQADKKEKSKELIKEEFDLSIPYDEIWEIKEMETFHGSSDSAGFAERDKLSFEDLIDLVGGQKRDFKVNPKPFVEEKVTEKSDINSEKEKLFKDKLMTKAIKLYEKENYTNAIKVFQELLLKYPEDTSLHGYIGNAYFRNKNYSMAEKEYEIVLKLEPENIQACENLGVVYANQGKLSEAIKQWDKLLKMVPERQDIHKSIMRAKRYLINN